MSGISELFQALADEARYDTMEALRPVFGEFTLTGWMDGIMDRLWPNPVYPWTTIQRIYIEPDRLELAMWADGELIALGVCQTKGENLEVCFIEGTSDEACSFTGNRAFILTEAAVRYAELRGKREVWLQPATSALVDLYVKGCRFEQPSPESGSQYLRRKVKP